MKLFKKILKEVVFPHIQIPLYDVRQKNSLKGVLVLKKFMLAASLAVTLGAVSFGFSPGIEAAEAPKNEKGKSVSAEHLKETPAFDKIKANQQPTKFHEGETPIDTFVGENGIVVEVYPAPEFTTMGAGTWDKVGTEYWVMNGDFDSRQRDGVYSSSGGDYMVRLPAHEPRIAEGTRSWLRIELWEDDTFDDDFVTYYEGTSYSWQAADYVFRDIGNYVDGSAAEFYTVHQANYVTDGLYAQYFD